MVLIVTTTVTVLAQQALDGVTVYVAVDVEESVAMPEIVPEVVLKLRPLPIAGEIANEVGDATQLPIAID
jgi:hypothetical protein